MFIPLNSDTEHNEAIFLAFRHFVREILNWYIHCTARTGERQLLWMIQCWVNNASKIIIANYTHTHTYINVCIYVYIYINYLNIYVYAGCAKSHFIILKINHAKIRKDRKRKFKSFYFNIISLRCSPLLFMHKRILWATVSIHFLRISGVRLRDM